MPFIALDLTLHTPLHVGGAGTGESVAITRDARGRPCIPATTLKGLHRAATERIALALELFICTAPIAEQMCHPIGGQPACVVCRIFGSPWTPGVVRCRDLIATAAPRTETHVMVPQSRRRRVQLGRYTYSRETLPAGLTLAGRIDLLTGDTGLIALALIGIRSVAVVGAGSAAGFGLCSIEARAFDAPQNPIGDNELAAGLRRLQSAHKRAP